MSIVLPEVVAMQAVADTIADLTPSERKRVALWLMEYVTQEDASRSVEVEGASELAPEPAAENEAPASESFSSFPALYEAVAPKTGAQKAVVTGYWIEKYEGQTSWKASQVNKMLKSIDVRVSSISIVLTNAVKAQQPMIDELGRLGDGQRSRKTFRLNDAGVAFVENRLG